MLENLEIANGEMTPKFDKYTDTYSVRIKSDIDNLDLKLKTENDEDYKIYGNYNLEEGENIVTIEINSEKGKHIYTLIVNKERLETVTSIDPNLETVEVRKELPEYVGPLIACVCFLIILFTFVLLFRRKK